MAAMRGQQVQGQHHGAVVRYHVLRQADREAGAKVRGVALECASRESGYRRRNAQLSQGELGPCLRVGSTVSAPGCQEE